MNEERKKEWVEALRSGEYEQTRNWLRTTDGHCCLGVACDLAVAHAVIPAPKLEDGHHYEYGSSAGALPDNVREWLAVSDSTVEIDFGQGEFINPTRYPTRHTNLKGVTLAGLNDTGLTFDQIADVIEWAL